MRNVDDIKGRGVKAVGPEQDDHHTDAQPPLPGLLRARQGGHQIFFFISFHRIDYD